MFFGIGQQEMTLEEIGDKFGLTRERVRQIKEKAIRRLRPVSYTHLLFATRVLPYINKEASLNTTETNPFYSM